MKMILQLFVLFLTASIFPINSYANPLHGNYTIGQGGNFPEIHDALTALDSLGLGGPVTFRILSGTYQGTNYLREVPNSNSTNTVTFESFAGNADSVVITDPSEYTFRIEGAKNLIITNLTLQNISMNGSCQNIHITGNKFTDHTIQMIDGQILGFYVQLNSALAGLTVNSMGVQMQVVRISNNEFSPLASYIILKNIHNVTIELNKKLGNLFMDLVNTVEVSANKLQSNQPGSNVVQIRESQIVYLKNNFIDCQGEAWGVSFTDNNLLNFINNTVRNEGLDTTLSAHNNSGLLLENNIYYNDSVGVSATLWNNTGFRSDYNMYYNGPDAEIIKYNGLPYTLTGFQTASGEDMNSHNYAATFADSNDLHLNTLQSGNKLLIGKPNPDVTIDIDGEFRNPIYPYRGADELDFPLPVEISVFTSEVNGSNVILNWTTVTEINNSGFQIERSSGNEQWNKIAFISGSGNSNAPVNYSYSDLDLSHGIYKYRLKQIDINGNFTYYNLLNDVEIGLPSKFELSQNYPNPFNPETQIRYSIPSEQFVKLQVYDLAGKEIKILVNEVQPAGSYEIKFNAASLSSGIYFYKMEAGVYSEVKRMMVVK